MTDMPSKDAKRHGTNTEGVDVTALIRQLAHALKQAYLFERRAYEETLSGRPSTYRTPRSAEAVRRQDVGDNLEVKIRPSQWIQIAKKLMAHRIDPVEYVRRIFAGISGTRRTPPSPAALLTDRWIEVYRHRCRADKKEIAVAFRTQKQVAKVNIGCYQDEEVSMQEATLQTLFDNELPLSALFRYCLASSMQSPAYARVLELYRVEAALQYIRNAKEYDRVWKGFIPAEFRGLANALYREYFA